MLDAQRYQVPRVPLPKPPPDMPFVLTTLKERWPEDDRFRQQLRVNPFTFDRIVDRIKDDLVFHNDSNFEQTAVEDQVAVAFYRMGRSGNGASIRDTSAWSGHGDGTVVLFTERVMTALLRQDLINEVLAMPTDEERENAAEWVESVSCVHRWSCE